MNCVSSNKGEGGGASGYLGLGFIKCQWNHLYIFVILNTKQYICHRGVLLAYTLYVKQAFEIRILL